MIFELSDHLKRVVLFFRTIERNYHDLYDYDYSWDY